MEKRGNNKKRKKVINRTKQIVINNNESSKLKRYTIYPSTNNGWNVVAITTDKINFSKWMSFIDYNGKVTYNSRLEAHESAFYCTPSKFQHLRDVMKYHGFLEEKIRIKI